MNTFKFWIAFSIGVASGAVIALICAPQSGEETREQLRRSFEDAGEQVKETAGDLSDKAKKAYKKGRDIASDYSDDVVDNLQSAVKGVKAQF